jgi:hypothetical protein
LAPYLFLIVGEALNVMIKKEQQEGRILGIKLPRLKEQQLIDQYGNDTTLQSRLHVMQHGDWLKY